MEAGSSPPSAANSPKNRFDWWLGFIWVFRRVPRCLAFEISVLLRDPVLGQPRERAYLPSSELSVAEFLGGIRQSPLDLQARNWNGVTRGSICNAVFRGSPACPRS